MQTDTDNTASTDSMRPSGTHLSVSHEYFRAPLQGSFGAACRWGRLVGSLGVGGLSSNSEPGMSASSQLLRGLTFAIPWERSALTPHPLSESSQAARLSSFPSPQRL